MGCDLRNLGGMNAKQMAQLRSTSKYMAQFLCIWGLCGPFTHLPFHGFVPFWHQGIGLSFRSRSTTWPWTKAYFILLYPNKTLDLSGEAGGKAIYTGGRQSLRLATWVSNNHPSRYGMMQSMISSYIFTLYWLDLPITIIRYLKKLSHVNSQPWSSWWFQPIWKILVKLDLFPK